MAITVATNFKYEGQSPNFERDQFKTIAEMTAYSPNYLDEGHISFCLEDKKHYKWNGTSWEEFKTGGGGITIVDSVDKLDPDAPQGSLASVAVNTISEVTFSELYQPTSDEVNMWAEVVDTTNLTRVSGISVNSSYDTTAEITNFIIYLFSKGFNWQRAGQVIGLGLSLQTQQYIGTAMTMNVTTQEQQEFELFTSNEDGTITVNEENLTIINNLLSLTEFVYGGILNTANGEFISPSYADVFYKSSSVEQKTELYIKDVNGWEEFKTGSEVVNNLEDTSIDKALSANMGRVLNERILATSSGSITRVAGTLNIKDLNAVKAAQKLLSNNQQITYIITDANGNYPSPNSPTVYLDTEDHILDILYRGNGDALKWLLLNKQAYYKVGNTWYSQTITNYIKIPSLHLRTAKVGDLITIVRHDMTASEFYSKYIDYDNLNLNLNTTDKAAFDGYLVALGIKGLLESISDGESIRRLVEGGYIYTAENNPEKFPETIMNPLVNIKSEGIRDITFYTAQIIPNTQNIYNGEFWSGNMTGPGIYSYITSGRPAGSEDGEFYTGYVSPDGTQTLVSMKDPNKVFTRAKISDDWVQKTVGKKTTGTGEIFNDYINNFAHTDHGHAEGQKCRAEGWNSHAEGFTTTAGTASTGNAHAEGSNTRATGNNSHSEGINTVAEGHNSHAEGDSATASNWNAHAEGYRTIASGNGAHAEGNSDGIGDVTCWNVASGFASHTEGSGTQATNKASHAEGMNTSSRGEGSHSEGMSTIAKGMASHAEGAGTRAEGVYSHAEGVYNYYNIPSLIHSVGIGIGALSAGDESYRTNAHAITLDGKHYIYGIGGYEGKGIENATDLATTVSNLNSTLGDINTILESIIGKPNIIFSIRSDGLPHLFTAQEGMTWLDYVNSSFNLGMFKIESNNVLYNSKTIINSNFQQQYPTDIIVANIIYEVL